MGVAVAAVLTNEHLFELIEAAGEKLFRLRRVSLIAPKKAGHQAIAADIERFVDLLPEDPVQLGPPSAASRY